MKLLNGTFTNFGSYPVLQFNFEETGLALIQGPTGAGKSTIADAACWAITGQTAKNGGVEDVRAWGSDEPTEATLDVETPTGIISIVRVRGGSKQNDLYWLECGDTEGMHHRGKDLSETQSRLEARLGITSDLYLTAAYFQEFSPTAAFFTADAKNRRQVFEGIADLTLPIKIAQASAQKRKQALKEAEVALALKNRLEGRLEPLQRAVEGAQRQAAQWETEQAARLATLQLRYDRFEDDKLDRRQKLVIELARWASKQDGKIAEVVDTMNAIEAKIEDPGAISAKLDVAETAVAKYKDKTKCPTCSAPVNHKDLSYWIEQRSQLKFQQGANNQLMDQFERLRLDLEALTEAINPFIAQIKAAEDVQNHYGEQLEAERVRLNPHTDTGAKWEAEQTEVGKKLWDAALDHQHLTQLVSAYEQLKDLSDSLRSELLRKAVQEAQDTTNEYLEKYFDAELRVTFTLEGADSLTVGIQKSGNDCVYRQLSKGQRQLLRLSFSLAIMAASANKVGVHFDNLFFDESLDGIDGDLKIKAFSLFEDLAKSHANILVIDHAEEFKQAFAKRYQVTMVGDSSEIEECE